MNAILECFKIGKIPEAVAIASFPIPDIPSAQWSLLNRTLVFLAGTADGRGFRQWKKVNRFVKKGTQSFYILVPIFRKIKLEENVKESGDEAVLYGFRTRPVFRYEDTQGEELEYRQIELPELPLLEKAEEWGISVKAIPGNGLYRGYFAPQRREIGLATPEEKTFFHELAHAGHEKVKGQLRPGQNPLQEVVAELAAQALCRMVGKRTQDTTGNSFQYIERYAKKAGMTPHGAAVKVLGETEKTLSIILEKHQKQHNS